MEGGVTTHARERRSENIGFFVRPSEKVEIDAAVAETGKTLSEWLRGIISKELRRRAHAAAPNSGTRRRSLIRREN